LWKPVFRKLPGDFDGSGDFDSSGVMVQWKFGQQPKLYAILLANLRAQDF
jgi:hypothetical protein